jgi:hypothetical protein
MRAIRFCQETSAMIRVNTGPHRDGNHPARSQDRTLHHLICALGLALFVSAPALAHAQATTAGNPAQVALPKEPAMTQPATTDTPVVAPTSRRVAGRDDVRPFRARVPEAEVTDLRRRLQATRWPDKETVADASQGAQLAKLQELVRYWATEYDWRQAARLARLGLRAAEGDRAAHRPTAHGGRAEDPFDLVLPSTREWCPPNTRIRAKRSSMSSKARWSMRSTVSRR